MRLAIFDFVWRKTGLVGLILISTLRRVVRLVLHYCSPLANAAAQLWQNVSANAGHWLEVKLQQPGPNRDAIGAWLEARCAGKVMRQEITIGGGHASGQVGWRHFGLGDATQAEVRVV
jgi:hypothetical protein